jgi:hypothetical protein
MSTTAASGSGEPPERRDYGSDRNLPRSALLEPAIRPDPQQQRFAPLLRAGQSRRYAAPDAGEALSRPRDALTCEIACAAAAIGNLGGRISSNH